MDVITTHINADFDCLGAMVAARKLYPGAVLVFPGGQERSLRDFFVRSALLGYNFCRVRDIDLHAIKRLILVDVRQSDRIGVFAAVAQRPDVELHIYDHHPDNRHDLHGSYEFVETVGATVTIFVKLFQINAIVPTAEESTLMMLGLYEDTGNLSFSSTTAEDFEAAAFLFRHGADLNTVAACLVQELTVDQVELLHQLLANRSKLHVHGIEITIAHTVFPRYVGDIAGLAHKIKDMESLDALILIVGMGERILMVGRSRRQEVAMGEILAAFGGGGHDFAASATIKDLTMVQILEQLPGVLLKHVRPCWEARHLMTQPVKSVSVETPLSQVQVVMTRYNINAVPVLDGDFLAGLLTRQVVDKAMHHGLSETAAREYMSREFVSATPTTSIEALRGIIVDGQQRFVPVLDKQRVVGVLTRTDLLRHLVSGQRALPLTGPALEGEALFRKRQVERLLRERLSADVLAMLQKCGALADELQMAVYIVGGFVRDLLLQQQNLDIDIVVEGDGIRFATEFVQRNGGRIRAHDKFSTAVMIFPDGFKVDVATTRMEYYLQPGALPTVENASLKLDLYRRDFTVNTLAIALNSQHFGELYDFFGGQEDLVNKSIRVLHNLSFVEDPTRAFRAIRFEQRLGFKIGLHTESLLHSAVRLGFVEKVGGARLRNELLAVLRESNPLPALQRMAELDMLRFLHPDLHLSSKSERLFEAASQVLHWHELLYTGESVERWQVYFLCLTNELTVDQLQCLARRLVMPERTYRELFSHRETAHELLAVLQRRLRRVSIPRPSELEHWFGSLSVNVILYLLAAIEHETIKRWLSHYLVHLRSVEIALTGGDLQALGLRPGPRYKEVFSAVLAAKLDGKLNSKQDEIDFVRKRFLS